MVRWDSPPMQIFEQDRCCLGSQPGMNPWEEGCQKLCEWMTCWLMEQLREWGIGCPKLSAETARGFLERQWRCWRLHWQDAIQRNSGRQVEGLEVAENIRRGQGYRGGGQLGGDVLADVILAEGCCLKAETEAEKEIREAAVVKFCQQYQRVCFEEAKKWHKATQAAWEDFWNRLLTHLTIGVAGEEGKLKKFEGRSGLRPWLKTVLGRFALNYRSPDKGPSGGGRGEAAGGKTIIGWEHLEELQDPKSRGPDESAMLNDLEKKAREYLESLLERESPRVQVGMKYVIEGVTLREAANLAGVHPGHLSRVWKQLEEKLTKIFGERG